MCVIFICDKGKPDPLAIEAAFDANPDGAGIAWRGEVKGKPVVHWEKGLNLEEIIARSAEVSFPQILHFRIATVGGAIPQLTHPFEISPTPSPALKGYTTNPVVFHNGHWNGWSQSMQDLAIRSVTPVPAGKWSDSRAMAFVGAILGIGYYELLEGQRIVAFGPKKGETMMFGKWSLSHEMIVSNTGWESRFNAAVWRRERGEKKVGAQESHTSSTSGDTQSPRRSLPQSDGVQDVKQHNEQCVCKDCRPDLVDPRMSIIGSARSVAPNSPFRSSARGVHAGGGGAEPLSGQRGVEQEQDQKAQGEEGPGPREDEESPDTINCRRGAQRDESATVALEALRRTSEFNWARSINPNRYKRPVVEREPRAPIATIPVIHHMCSCGRQIGEDHHQLCTFKGPVGAGIQKALDQV